MSETTTEAPESIRDTIEAAFTEHETKAATPEATESDSAAAQRARDEAGRFVKVERDDATQDAPEAEPTVEAKAPVAETQEGAAAEVAPEKAAVEARKAPDTWTAADRDMFAKAPAEAQDFLLRRMGEMETHFTRRNQEIAAFRRDYWPVAEMLNPHMGTMREKGFTPATLLKNYIDTDRALLEGRGVDVIANIVKGYGIDPHAVVAKLGVAPRQAADAADPNAQAGQILNVPPELINTVQGVVQRLNAYESRQQQDQQRQEQQREHAVNAEIARFAQEKDASGALLRPLFSDVQDDMASLAVAIQQKGGDIPPLAELYESAVWANPITRSRIQADQAAAQEAQRAARDKAALVEARAKAVKAQRASTPVTGSPGAGHNGVRANGPLTLHQQIEQAAAEAGL